MMHLTPLLNFDTLNPSHFGGGMSMNGGYYRPKDRKTYRVWIPWHGKNIFVNKYLDGTSLYHEAQAQRVLEKIRGEIDAGTFDPAVWGKDKTIFFPNAWRIYQEQSPCGKARHDDRERIYLSFLFPYFKDFNLRELEEHHVRDWFSGLPVGMAPSYRRMVLATLKGFLHFHRVTRQKVFQYPTVTVPRKVVSWLTTDDQDRVFEFIPDQHKPILTVIRTYGCRPSEACNLKKADIDWEKKVVVFRDRKNSEDNILPIVPVVEEALRAPKAITHWEYAFCTERGRKYTRQALYATWMRANREAARKYGVRVVSLKNATRHSLASQLLEKGETIPMIARILGNSPSVVEQTYARLRVSAVKNILEDRTHDSPRTHK